MHRLYASSFPVIHIHAATMTISDLSMIWVNISPLYFCFISLFFQPLVLPYGSVYCFKFKIWYSRFYWSMSTKDPQPSLVCRCGFFRPSQVWVNIPKRKFRTELMHFSQSCEENVWMGSFSKNWNKYVGFFFKKKIFLGLWLWVAIKTATTISRRKWSFQGIKAS